MGDELLRVFAKVVHSSMRASDIVGRLGGEEFAAVVPEPMETGKIIAERIRVGFETAGAVVSAHAIGATVSIGLTASSDPVDTIDLLLARADAALYRAKRDGRNRARAEGDDQPSERARLIAAARSGQAAIAADEPARLIQRKRAARRAKSEGVPAGETAATSRLLYRR
jgi:predicted signal transduction protein with EAL and GGDEF domain